jgi:sucrose phosphorylase
VKNQVQLITYVDRLSGGGLRELQGLLEGPLRGLFGGVHLLPFFDPIDGADAGFDPIDHARVDPRLGDWDDVRALAGRVDVMADLIVNHVSSRSPQFLDYRARGEASPWAGLFLTFERVFPRGASEADLLRIYRPRPSLPFTPLALADGRRRLFWTTFTAEQLDLDLEHPQGAAYLTRILETFARAGVRLVRLDAAGYAVKRAGSSCFMLPETYDLIGALSRQARSLGIEVLVEIHAHYRQQIEIARRVDRVYDFALPPLVLHALLRADAGPLQAWLDVAPRNAVTVLDTHDGIGVLDVGASGAEPGLLPPADIDALVEEIHRRSGGESRLATGAAASNLDLYQVNCTYYDALGGDEEAYLLARAIQFFAPGVPQVYYVGLLGGRNDLELLRRSGVGRDINRHAYVAGEIGAALARPMVQRLFRLIRFRNAHPAFDGDFIQRTAAGPALDLEWRRGAKWARLQVDLGARRARVTCSGTPDDARAWGDAAGVGALAGGEGLAWTP